MSVRIVTGDCRLELAAMPDNSVDCCVTSPPYFGLRDYGVDGQIGLEATPAEYVAEIVAVFRQVKRVLSDDGTLWLNLADSYAGSWGAQGHRKTPETLSRNSIANHPKRASNTGTVANVANLLSRELERGVLFFGSTDPRGISAERVHVLVYDQSAPDCIFEPLFRAKRICIKERQHDLCQVGGALDAPVTCWVSRSLCFGKPDAADAEGFVHLGENVSIVVTTGDLDTDAAFRAVVSRSVKHGKASFAVEVAAKPISETVAYRATVWDAVTLHSGAKRAANIHSVNEAVALANGLHARAGASGHLSVRDATEKHFALNLHGAGELCFQTVSHLFLLRYGVTPYSNLLEKAIRERNASQPKQELGIPDMVKRGLMEDGWICRQTIIWSKPNPMPESVTDRCTKAHEYLFLLSKSPRYYFDQAAISEPIAAASIARLAQDIEGQAGSSRVPGKTNGTMKAVGKGNAKTFRGGGSYTKGQSFQNDAVVERESHGNAANETGLRNKRSVWTIATQPYSEAHFATFPPDLIEPCILAGSRKGGTILDPFGGAGTTALVADRLGRNAISIELNPEYVELQRNRIADDAGMFANVEAA